MVGTFGDKGESKIFVVRILDFLIDFLGCFFHGFADGVVFDQIQQGLRMDDVLTQKIFVKIFEMLVGEIFCFGMYSGAKCLECFHPFFFVGLFPLAVACSV